jgi:putative DNA primase/helicase
MEAPTANRDLHEIVSRLGGDLYQGGRAAVIPGPGHSRQDRSLSLSLVDGNPPRILWKSWANDPGEAVWPYLGIGRQSARPMSKAEADRARAARDRQRRAELELKLAFCREVWAGSVDAMGSPVEAYLRSRAVSGAIPPTLRFHPAAPWGYPDPAKPSRTFPAMVAIVTAPDGRNAAGLHMTALRPDGSAKAPLNSPRLMFGDLVGAVVQLGPLPPSGELAIAEGIETALSYRDLTGAVTWAALSTSGLRRFMPPDGVKRLTVAADSDDAKGEGIAAARELAERASRKCDAVVIPAPEGLDWNDVAQGATQ